MELKPLSTTAKALGQEFTGGVYVNLIHRGEDPSRMIVGLSDSPFGLETLRFHFVSVANFSYRLGRTLISPKMRRGSDGQD
jgi:hypothetical protein